nr:LysR family transcriptional regulator [Rhodoplanes tepidamans]
MQAFYWVARLGGFHRAAARLNVTQPAVSQRVVQLERELGVQLLERTRRSVACTERGRDLLAHVERMLALHDAMHHAIAAPEAVHGLIRLGVVETIVHTWLQDFMRLLDERHPRLVLEIDAGASPSLEEKLHADEIDIGFLLLPLSHPGLEVHELCSFPMGMVASPRLGLGGRRVPLARVAAYPLATFARGGEIHARVRAVFADIADLRLHASATLAPIVRMAVDGLAVACVPPAAVAREIADGELEVVRTGAVLADLRFAACWRPTPERRLVRAVAAIAAEVAQSHPPAPARPVRRPRARGAGARRPEHR